MEVLPHVSPTIIEGGKEKVGMSQNAKTFVSTYRRLRADMAVWGHLRGHRALALLSLLYRCRGIGGKRCKTREVSSMRAVETVSPCVRNN